MTTLLKKLEHWTEADFIACAEDQTRLGGTHDEMTAGADRLRERIERGEQAFTAEEMILALNCFESGRLLGHILAEMIEGSIEKLRARFQNGRCLYCDWQYGVDLYIPKNREMTDGEVSALDAQMSGLLEAHVLVCPKHPMRDTEKQLATEATEHARIERELRRELAAVTRPANCVDHRGQGCGWCHIAGALA